MIATRRVPALPALLLLAACGQDAEPAPPVADEALSTATPAPAPAESGDRIRAAEQLIGEYRLAGVGDQGVDLPYGITVSITGDTIHVTADCVNVEWGYVMEDGDLATLRIPTEGCARGLAPIEEALVEGFDKAERVSRNRTNGYDFTGSGPTVTLFTQ